MTTYKEIQIRTARTELALACETFLEKVEALERLEGLSNLHTSVYEACDLTIFNATTVVHFIKESLKNEND